MRTLLGVKKEGEGKTFQKIKKLSDDETLKFNVGSTEQTGRIVKVIDVTNKNNLGYH